MRYYNEKTNNIEIEIVKYILESIEIIARESKNPELAKDMVANALDIAMKVIKDTPFLAIPKFKFACKSD